MSGDSEKEVKAVNEAGARVGDRIVLSFKTSSLLKASFLLYVLPVLFLIVGAVVGHRLAAVFNLNSSALSAVAGFLFFFSAVWLIKSKVNQLARKDEYQPKIIKIVKQRGLQRPL